MKTPTLEEQAERIGDYTENLLRENDVPKILAGNIALMVAVKVKKTLLTAEKRGVDNVIDILKDHIQWYNTNNQIPDSELGKGEEHWKMLTKIVEDSLKEVEERVVKESINNITKDS